MMIFNNQIFYIIILLWGLAGSVPGVHAQSWTRVAEIDSTHVFSVIDHNDVLYAVTAGQVFKSPGAGAAWQPTASKPNVMADFQTLFSHGAYLYLGTLGDGIFRSSDGGQNWQGLNSGLSGNAANIISLTALGDSLYAGTNGSGVYVINLQNPASWSAFNQGLFQFGVNSIATSGENLILAAGLYLFIRARTATQWTDVYLDSAGVQRQVFETHVLNQYLYAGTDNGVYRGTLAAQNWQRVDIAAFPNRDIVALAADPSRIISGLWFSGQHWIFSSENAGITWDFRAHEFAELWDLYVSGNHLWAGRSDGLWYVNLDVWTGIDAPPPTIASGYRLHQNYPNPFNPTTTISYTLPRVEHVELKVYDIRGALIATLQNEFKFGGTHSVDFNAHRLGTGIYIYKIKAGNFNAVKKMLLVK